MELRYVLAAVAAALPATASLAQEPARVVVAAAAAKMAGNVSGLFYDGETLEWPVCTGVAMFAVAVTVGLASRR